MKDSSFTVQPSCSNEVTTKIGLEVHVTLSSLKKIFNFNYNSSGNERLTNSVEAWQLGYLGTLPVLNDEVIKFALKACLFLNAEISKELTFNRKVYNYFDLPKGFQITQQENPIGKNGHFTFVLAKKAVTVPISRIQLEEDTAKASYQGSEIMLDFNRSGNPLLEIVTEPVFSDIDSVISFIKQLQSALNYIGVSEAKMEQGGLRVDLNFSFLFGQEYQTPRYEVKNLNSIKNLRISFEQELEKHKSIYKNKSRKSHSSRNQTLGFNEFLKKTFVQRKKVDYFYLPENNIPIILVDDDEIDSLQKEIPTNLSSLWHKLDKVNSSYSSVLFEKPLFARVVNSLEKERIDYIRSFDPFASFFFNYVLVNIHDYNSHKTTQFLTEKVKYLWELFVFFEKRILTKEKVSSLIIMLSTEYKSYSILQWQRLLEKEKDSERGPLLDIEKEITIILDEKKMNRKLVGQPSRIASFLLGNLRNKFPSSRFDYQKVLEIANSLAAKVVG